MTTPRQVVERMLRADAFSRWLGIELVDADAGRATARMTVRAEMVNGFGIGHGGIVYALADSVFAFTCNSNGEISVAVDCTMSYPAATHPGDVLTATGVERTGTRRLGWCDVTITNQHDAVVGLFRGTIYRTHKPLFPGTPDEETPS
jgi:acyl-CoA thioesterase